MTLVDAVCRPGSEARPDGTDRGHQQPRENVVEKKHRQDRHDRHNHRAESGAVYHSQRAKEECEDNRAPDAFYLSLGQGDGAHGLHNPLR